MGKRIKAGGPGSGRKPGFENPMHVIRGGISRGHLPKNATPEMRALQVIEDRKAIQRFDALARNLKQNVSPGMPATD